MIFLWKNFNPQKVKALGQFYFNLMKNFSQFKNLIVQVQNFQPKGLWL
jgi:hypothetical protein